MYSDGMSGSYIIDRRPSSEFCYEAANVKLLNLDINGNDLANIVFTTPGDDLTTDVIHETVSSETSGHIARQMRLGGSINLECRLTVRCFLTLHSSY